MAAAQGYQCDLVDSVPEDCYCKKCSLVARRLTVTSCCGEHYCHACIAGTQQQDKPCPECVEESFTFLELVKYQKRIASVRVYCSLKGRGCDWSGTLEELDAHLDPDLDNCQYVDTKCPLNCQQAIPKNKVEQHVREECVKREHVCQHCNFKATYEEVVDTHLPECMYVPLQCPNFCGVTSEREMMEDHMKICRLEEVKCEFSDVGCGERFRREDQEEHTRQNYQRHLSLMAASTAETNRQMEKKLDNQIQKFEKITLEYEHKFQERFQQEQELKLKVGQQEQTLVEQQQKMQDKEQKLQDQENKLQEQMQEVQDLRQNVQDCEKKIQIQEQKLEDQEQNLQNQEKRYQDHIQKFEEQQEVIGILDNRVKQQQQKLSSAVKDLQEKTNNSEKILSSLKNAIMTRTFSVNYMKDKKYVEDEPGYTYSCADGYSSASPPYRDNYQFSLESENTSEIPSQIPSQIPAVSSYKSDIWWNPKAVKRSHKSVKPSYKTVTSSHISAKPSLKSVMPSHSCATINDWNSPAMYAYPGGYKFRIDIDDKTSGVNGLQVKLKGLSGEYDDQLQWPARVSFIVELVNWKGGDNWKVSKLIEWKKGEEHILTYVGAPEEGIFIENSKLDSYLSNGNLQFKVISMLW